MKIHKLEKMIRGWFVGDFEPSAYKTKRFEVALMSHKKGEEVDNHYHEKCDEINLMVSGSAIINGVTINCGDIFILKKNEIVRPVFLEDALVVVIKTRSNPKDKVVVKQN